MIIVETFIYSTTYVEVPRITIASRFIITINVLKIFNIFETLISGPVLYVIYGECCNSFFFKNTLVTLIYFKLSVFAIFTEVLLNRK